MCHGLHTCTCTMRVRTCACVCVQAAGSCFICWHVTRAADGFRWISSAVYARLGQAILPMLRLQCKIFSSRGCQHCPPHAFWHPSETPFLVPCTMFMSLVWATKFGSSSCCGLAYMAVSLLRAPTSSSLSPSIAGCNIHALVLWASARDE